MAKSIVSVAEPFFLQVLSIVNKSQSTTADKSQLDQLQKQLKQDLMQIEHQVNSGAISGVSGEWPSLKRMLIYWADEVLTDHIPDWQNFILEREFFEERKRASQFYVEAEECLPTASPAAAELVYLATVLGFKGDIEEAFRHGLRQEMPGGHSDPEKARYAWAGHLQRRIQHDSENAPQQEPLEGDAEPLPAGNIYQTAMVFFVLAVLSLMISGYWYIDNENKNPIEMDDSEAAILDLGSSPAVVPRPVNWYVSLCTLGQYWNQLRDA